MCGRYSLTQLPDKSKLVKPEGLDLPLEPRYNIAPTNYCPIVPQSDPKHIHLFRWGLVPHWAKDVSIGYKMINARSETLHEKASFKTPLKSSRCLVLADGFYEWKKTSTGKQPYRILLKNNEIFSMAGLYDQWQTPEGKSLFTFTIITTTGNEIMEGLHDRMPAILHRKDAIKWLNPNLEMEEAQALLRPFESELMKTYAVSSAVGNVRNDTEDLIKPLSE